MKATFLVIMLTVSTSLAWARAPLGSDCGLVDYSSDHSIKDITETFIDLGKSGTAKLSTLQKQQIIAGAQTIFSGLQGKISYGSAEAALQDLLRFSAAGVFLGQVEINGKIFDELMTYPSEKPVGILFEQRALSIRAFIQESDVVCNQL